MKLYLMSLIILLAAAGAQGQETDTWKVMLNKHIICEGEIDQKEKTGFINRATLKNAEGNLYISYKAAEPQEGWKRIFYINNQKDSVYSMEEIPKQSGRVCVPVKLIQQMMEKNEKMVIHTTSIPIDPEQAAMVRVRRFTLCKIEWK